MMKEQIGSIMHEEIARGLLAGGEVLAAQNGQVVFNECYGSRVFETLEPMPMNAIYRLYSMSKPVTSAAVMMLCDKGSISLDDEVSQYLPGFANQRVCENGYLVPAKRAVTLRDLMNMVSGVVYPSEDIPGQLVGGILDEQIKLHSAGGGVGTVELCDRIGRQPLAFHPGEHWRYGLSADVLGAVVEVASGKRFGQFLKDELFDPLGMTDTGFSVPTEKQGRLAQIYSCRPEQGRPVAYTGANLAIFDFTRPPAYESGGAGLCSTAKDYLQFATMLQNGGELNGKCYLKEETVRFMRTNQLTDKTPIPDDWAQLKGFGYGNLMRSLLKPCDANAPSPIGEYGWDGWAGTYFSNDPVNHVTILLMISRVDIDQRVLHRHIRQAVYQGLGLN